MPGGEKEIKFFPFRPRAFFFPPSSSSSGFRLLDVSSHPGRGGGGLGPQAPRPLSEATRLGPGGLGHAESRGGGGASVAQGQSLRARLGAARAAWRGLRQGGPAWAAHLRGAGAARRSAGSQPPGWPCCAAPAAARRPRPLPAPKRAAGRERGGWGEGARGAPWVPASPAPSPPHPCPALGKLSKTLPWVREAPWTKERKRREKRFGRFLWAAQSQGFTHRLGLICPRSCSGSTQNWG